MTNRTSRSYASIAAADTYTPWVEIRGIADVSISGISDSIVTVQRSFDGGTTIKDVEQFTAYYEGTLEGSDQGASYRIGIKTGDYGTDTVLCEISK